MSDTQRIEKLPEATEAVKRFAALPREKQEAALLIMHGIQIGEQIMMEQASRPGA